MSQSFFQLNTWIEYLHTRPQGPRLIREVMTWLWLTDKHQDKIRQSTPSQWVAQLIPVSVCVSWDSWESETNEWIKNQEIKNQELRTMCLLWNMILIVWNSCLLFQLSDTLPHCAWKWTVAPTYHHRHSHRHSGMMTSNICDACEALWGHWEKWRVAVSCQLLPTRFVAEQFNLTTHYSAPCNFEISVVT